MKMKLFIAITFSLLVISVAAQDARSWVNRKEWARGLKLMPHSATNFETFRKQYWTNKRIWDSAFAFMRKTDLVNLPVGRHTIEGSDAYAIVTEGPSRDLEKTTWEAHQDYIDLHYIISGEEIIGICPVEKATVVKPYDPKTDIANYSAEGAMEKSEPGTFFLFFPGEAHRPNITTGGNQVVKKLVIKIRYKS